ncbi:MAG: thioredoxin family protein [Alistipes ihumii]
MFVDVYATWCGPCQIMAKQIFPQQKVGEFFNKTFVNAKFNAEKGEGVDVAKRYSVKAYPTFLILDSDGEEVGRIVGGADADRFIEEVRKVLENIER